MTFPFPGLLPVLRASEKARSDGHTFHVEIPGDRVSATPLAAFTTGRGLLSRAEVMSANLSGEEMLSAALANLAARPATWHIEEKAGGFLGLWKKPAILSYTDAFAAEQLLLKSVLGAAHRMLCPNDVNPARTAFFAPKRGQIRAVLAETDKYEPTPFVEREIEIAKQAWASAGDEGVMPAAFSWSPSSRDSNAFKVGRRFAGTESPYLPLAENVRLMVVKKRMLAYLANAAEAPKRELAPDLFLTLGVRSLNGDQTLLSDATLNQLGIPFEASLERMVSNIKVLPAIDMGRLGSGHPVVGFRGNGAIDQLASPPSLGRLHAMLGDPYVLHVYSHVRIAATAPNLPRTMATLVELVELCDPREAGVIMTRGTPDTNLYVVSGGKISGTTSAVLGAG